MYYLCGQSSGYPSNSKPKISIGTIYPGRGYTSTRQALGPRIRDLSPVDPSIY
jgi:hypothetical protein